MLTVLNLLQQLNFLQIFGRTRLRRERTGLGWMDAAALRRVLQQSTYGALPRR